MPFEHSCLSVLLFEKIYYYHGHSRWNYGWATPNYAGAFLATVEPAIWMAAALLSRKWRGKATGWFQFFAELVFWFLLAQTYSRGAIVAAFCARVAWQAMQGELTAVKTWGCYLVAPLASSFLTGFSGRIYEFIGDPSVEHRLEIWLAAPRMFAAAPWTGWGLEKSGFAYVNWYQNPSSTSAVFGLVNSYLTLGAEQGLPALCLVIFVSMCLICGGISGARSAAKAGRSSPVLAAATSVCVAWLIASVFSTLWAVPYLWVMPGLAACAIIGSRQICEAFGVRKILACGLFALGSAFLLLFLGTALERRSPILVHRGDNDSVTLESRIRSAKNKDPLTVDIWSDPLVLGKYPGRPFRAWMLRPGGPECLVVHASFKDNPQPARDNRILLLVGRRAALLSSLLLLPPDRIILVNPLEWSHEGLSRLRGHKAVIVIPEIDQTGTNDAVKNEAQALGVKVLLSPGMGLDLRSAWLDIAEPTIHSL
jgi:hypothetical protein